MYFFEKIREHFSPYLSLQVFSERSYFRAMVVVKLWADTKGP